MKFSVIITSFLSYFLIFSAQANTHEVKMKLSSTAFQEGAPIPKKYTCSGDNVSPPLTISAIPEGAKSLALIVDDPDAPMGTYVHWVAWNIKADAKELVEGAKLSHQGKNGYAVNEYRGPCPPPGKPHRYFFKLYALDTLLSLSQGAQKSELLKAMEGHIIAKTELMGTFQR